MRHAIVVSSKRFHMHALFQFTTIVSWVAIVVSWQFSRLDAWHPCTSMASRVTILVNWVSSRILSYDILFLGNNLKTTYFVFKVIIPSDRGWNYESNSVKKLIFGQKSSYDSCKLSQRYISVYCVLQRFATGYTNSSRHKNTHKNVCTQTYNRIQW